METSERDDLRTYIVVTNREEQYSIVAKGLPIPLGWKSTGKEGLRTYVLAFIDDVWTDLRPLSLRKKV